MEENMKKLARILLLGVMVCAAALPSFATDVSFTVFSDEEMNYYYYDMSLKEIANKTNSTIINMYKKNKSGDNNI